MKLISNNILQKRWSWAELQVADQATQAKLTSLAPIDLVSALAAFISDVDGLEGSWNDSSQKPLQWRTQSVQEVEAIELEAAQLVFPS